MQVTAYSHVSVKVGRYPPRDLLLPWQLFSLVADESCDRGCGRGRPQGNMLSRQITLSRSNKRSSANLRASFNSTISQTVFNLLSFAFAFASFCSAALPSSSTCSDSSFHVCSVNRDVSFCMFFVGSEDGRGAQASLHVYARVH